MPSLVLCYAADDEIAVRRIGGYLETNLPLTVSYSEAVVRPGLDLVDATERAISAEMALVFLSPHSVPAVWNRPKWEPVFFEQPDEFGALLGFVLLADCKFPELIRRKSFFDARMDLDHEARRLRRWLLHPDWPVGAAVPASELADRPGAKDLACADAEAFGAAHGADFEGVFRIDCQNRSNAGILGDLGHAMELRLPGTTFQNRAALQAESPKHRRLFLIAHATPAHRELLEFGGLASLIFLTDSPFRTPASLEEVIAAFLTLVRDEALCSGLLGDAIACLDVLPEPDLIRLGWAILAHLKESQRYAEVIELLEFLHARAGAASVKRIEWELSWFCDKPFQGKTDHILPTAAGNVVQLSLFS
jgi:hypothetical protein